MKSLVRRNATPQDIALAEMLVNIRQVQGWNLQPAKDAKLMAMAWKKQLDRRGVDYHLYDKLVDMAVDHRTRQISTGVEPVPLTVELILSCFDVYRSMVLANRQQLQQTIDYVHSMIERVGAGVVPAEVGFATLLSLGTESDESVADFATLSSRILDRLGQRLNEFSEEFYI